MNQPVTEEWMQRLGREDGMAVADWIIDELGSGEALDESKVVGESAVARIRALVLKYEERGVSESLVEIWRTACVTEIYRRFAEIRASKEADSSKSALADSANRTTAPVDSDR